MQTTPRPSGDAVTVSIYDQLYTLRGPDPAFLERLAELVDAKMRAVVARGTTADSLRVAVLAALNIADELLLAREALEALAGTEQSQRHRAHSLNGLLDEVLLDKASEDAPLHHAG